MKASKASTRTPRTAAAGRAPKKDRDQTDDPGIHAQFQRILVPVDFSEPSRRALRFARECASRFESEEVCLLHVIEPANTYGILGTEPIVVPIPTPDFHEVTRAELEKLVHREFPRSASVSVHVRDGVPYDEIVTAARELNADVIIIATQGRTGLSHALLGSTAERVVRHAHCPVLTLRCAR